MAYREMSALYPVFIRKHLRASGMQMHVSLDIYLA